MLAGDERAAITTARETLPEVEQAVLRQTAEVTLRAEKALADLHAVLIEREQRRGSLTWAQAIASGRQGKTPDPAVPVGQALRGVVDLLRR